ncbi:MAG: hypothetical protein AAF790_13010 [Planctomycetota bacterium]
MPDALPTPSGAAGGQRAARARVRVAAPSRLHFGLYAFADSLRAFGGVGVMIDRPGLALVCEAADRSSAEGPHAKRALAFAQQAAAGLGLEQPACRVRVESAPPEHAGLGLGTQLGMAVAAGVAAVRNRTPGAAAGLPMPAGRLAALVGRGLRSAIGVHGFERGGWLLDGGHTPGAALGQIEQRLPLPEAWRFVLISQGAAAGLSGRVEKEAFATLPPIPPATTQRLRRLATDEMAPAIAAEDYERFAAAAGEYGLVAGGCFASVQGGPFASPAIAGLVRTLQAWGYAGSGQSSWGPTVFALCRGQADAEELRARLLAEQRFAGADLVLSSPNNTGAAITPLTSPPAAG